MWWIVGFITYVLGAYLTFQYNAYLVREMVMVRGHIIVRNAILWPVFLPLLIWSSRR
jgi:hypothetical protein